MTRHYDGTGPSYTMTDHPPAPSLPAIKGIEGFVDEISEMGRSPLTPYGRDCVRTVLLTFAAHVRRQAPLAPPVTAAPPDSILMAANAMRGMCAAALRRAIHATKTQPVLPLTPEECVTIIENFKIPDVPVAENTPANLRKRAEPVTAAPPTTWQPIETAPRNGTSFLACSAASSVFFAHWANGVVDGTSWTDEGGYEGRHATHWQPLPAPYSPVAEPVTAAETPRPALPEPCICADDDARHGYAICPQHGERNKPLPSVGSVPREAPPAVEQALSLARQAVNGWACYAKRQVEHDDIARLHKALDALELAAVEAAR